MTSSNTDITSVQHQRLRDTLRLAQSRQQNIEESLKRLRSLQEKLYRHQQLNSELAEAHHQGQWNSLPGQGSHQ